MTLAARLGWLKRGRSALDDNAAGAAAASPSTPAARVGGPWLRWGAFRPRAGTPPHPDDPLLRLAADWISLQGGAIQSAGADGLSATWANGVTANYTRSLARAGADASATLLAPGTPSMSNMLDDISHRASIVHLSLDAPVDSAERIARAAFVPPGAGCTSCAQSESPLAGHACGPDCPLAAGHFVVVGLDKGVGAVRLDAPGHALNLEYTVRLAVSSYEGRGEDTMRVCIEAETGRALTPLPHALLSRASAASRIDGLRDLLAAEYTRVEPVVAAAARAAAHFARLRSLSAFRQRQEHVTRMYDRLLLEAPERAPDLLDARARELHRGAETSAVECDVRPLAAATIRVPVVSARVRFAGGGEVPTQIDLLRQVARTPRCAACGSEWRVGARCAAGHVTCLACSQTCAHCGARRCSLCATPTFQPCPMCSSLSCARCHAAAARGKHRPPRSQGAPPALIDTTPTPEEQLSSHDLTLADLEAMSPATWQRFVTWLLATEGYVRERELGEVAGLPLVLYRRTSAEPGSLHAQVTHAVPVVAVVSHRPTEADAWLDRGLLAQAEGRGASADDAPIMLITTARASDPATPFGGKSVMIRDRVALDSALNQLRSAYERQRTEHESEQRGRAEAAARVRVSLIDGLTQASVLLDSQEPVPASSAEASARHDDIRQRLAVVHQALAAIETLVAEWEGAFGPTAARDGSLPLLVSAAEYDALHARATHLVGVLAKATAALKAAEPPTDRSLDAWWDAVREEITLRMRSLAERCAALDPLAWQSFSQAHDTAAAARATDLLAASGRATLRASRLLDELASRAPAVRRVNQPRGQ